MFKEAYQLISEQSWKRLLLEHIKNFSSFHRLSRSLWTQLAFKPTLDCIGTKRRLYLQPKDPKCFRLKSLWNPHLWLTRWGWGPAKHEGWGLSNALSLHLPLERHGNCQTSPRAPKSDFGCQERISLHFCGQGCQPQKPFTSHLLHSRRHLGTVPESIDQAKSLLELECDCNQGSLWLQWEENFSFVCLGFLHHIDADQLSLAFILLCPEIQIHSC